MLNRKNHDHYSEEVKAIIAELRECMSQEKHPHERMNIRPAADRLQGCWNRLVIARKQETGVAYYLGPEEYKEAVRGHGS